MLRGPDSRKGLTLIEIISVIVLLGILTAVAVPRFRSDFSSKQRLKSEAQKIAVHIRYARNLAITDKNAARYIIRFNYDANNYGIYLGSVAPANLSGSLISIPSTVTASGETEIIFFNQGNCTFTGNGEINVRAGENNYKITVKSATGRVRVNES